MGAFDRSDMGCVAFYLQNAGRFALLTPAQEIELARQVQAMQSLIADSPDGPYDRLQQRIMRIGKRAKDKLILCNMRLVVQVAKKYLPRARSMGMEDLLQEGVLGLIRAAEKFDPARGFRFSTYSYWWIRQGITRGIAMYDRSIRLPGHASDILMHVRHFKERFNAEHGRYPTIVEIAAECEVSPDMMRTYLEHAQGTRSLQERCDGGRDESSFLIDMIASDADPWEFVLNADQEQRMGQLASYVERLPERQAEVVQLRFFPEGQPDPFDPANKALTLSQMAVSKRLGISRQAVADTERRALMALRLQLNCA